MWRVPRTCQTWTWTRKPLLKRENGETLVTGVPCGAPRESTLPRFDPHSKISTNSQKPHDRWTSLISFTQFVQIRCVSRGGYIPWYRKQSEFVKTDYDSLWRVLSNWFVLSSHRTSLEGSPTVFLGTCLKPPGSLNSFLCSNIRFVKY